MTAPSSPVEAVAAVADSKPAAVPPLVGADSAAVDTDGRGVSGRGGAAAPIDGDTDGDTDGETDRGTDEVVGGTDGGTDEGAAGWPAGTGRAMSDDDLIVEEARDESTTAVRSLTLTSASSCAVRVRLGSRSSMYRIVVGGVGTGVRDVADRDSDATVPDPAPQRDDSTTAADAAPLLLPARAAVTCCSNPPNCRKLSSWYDVIVDAVGHADCKFSRNDRKAIKDSFTISIALIDRGADAINQGIADAVFSTVS
jgi:hypothetical protein